MKTILVIVGATILLLAGGAWWSGKSQSVDPNVIVRNGLHWHPKLEIYIKGEKIEIPQNIGLGAVHQPMHTHDDLPLIHLEFGGVVRKQDLVLGQFFKNWGKDINSFGANMRPSDERGSAEASRPNVKMTVNGEENTEFENYQMKDGDEIELRYD